MVYKGHRGGKPVLRPDNEAAQKPWVEAVKWAITDSGNPRIEGPVRVEIVFTMPRPKKYDKPKHRNARPATKPDMDKLTRSTWDALTTMRVIEDDSRIVESAEWKRYEGADGALDRPGAVIVVKAVEVSGGM